ncbi:MAG: pantetheine-phosphate adenylyltransferase [Muribaculaceae bacterium]|nr:pantetheine-phosphate adenylyltransferase [Muribaculaceae bacterium]MDE6321588.1 pantetheine-phosphate adenylyltransferase [Muribaculaceae bacterium]
MTQKSTKNNTASPAQERIALFAGTFDPFTIGHKSIVDRGLKLFDRIIIAVGVNADKPSGTPTAQRLESIRQAFEPGTPIDVISYTDLTADTARRYGATALLRGVRTVADFEYERTLADINLKVLGIDTVMLAALPELSMVSSSMVRDLRRHGYDATQFIP